MVNNGKRTKITLQMKNPTKVVLDLRILPQIKKMTKEKEREVIRMLMQDNRLALKYLEDK